jgi:hypothetical protein
MPKYWIKRVGCTDEEAFGIQLDAGCDVSDLLQQATAVFDFGLCKPAELRVVLHGEVLSNRRALQDADLASTFVVEPKEGAENKFHAKSSPEPQPAATALPQPPPAPLSRSNSQQATPVSMSPSNAASTASAYERATQRRLGGAAAGSRRTSSPKTVAEPISKVHAPPAAHSARSPTARPKPVSEQQHHHHTHTLAAVPGAPPLPTSVSAPAPVDGGAKPASSLADVPKTRTLARNTWAAAGNRNSPARVRSPSPLNDSVRSVTTATVSGQTPPSHAQKCHPVCDRFEPQWGTPATCGRCKQHRSTHGRPNAVAAVTGVSKPPPAAIPSTRARVNLVPRVASLARSHSHSDSADGPNSRPPSAVKRSGSGTRHVDPAAMTGTAPPGGPRSNSATKTGVRTSSPVAFGASSGRTISATRTTERPAAAALGGRTSPAARAASPPVVKSRVDSRRAASPTVASVAKPTTGAGAAATAEPESRKRTPVTRPSPTRTASPVGQQPPVATAKRAPSPRAKSSGAPATKAAERVSISTNTSPTMPPSPLAPPQPPAPPTTNGQDEHSAPASVPSSALQHLADDETTAREAAQPPAQPTAPSPRHFPKQSSRFRTRNHSTISMFQRQRERLGWIEVFRSTILVRVRERDDDVVIAHVHATTSRSSSPACFT